MNDDWKWDKYRRVYIGPETCTVVPAQPGFSVVEPISNGDVIDALHYDPVLAWVMKVEVSKTTDGYVEHHPQHPIPISLNGGAGGDYAAIRRPDGVIVFWYDREFDQEAPAIEYFQKLNR